MILYWYRQFHQKKKFDNISFFSVKPPSNTKLLYSLYLVEKKKEEINCLYYKFGLLLIERRYIVN